VLNVRLTSCFTLLTAFASSRHYPTLHTLSYEIPNQPYPGLLYPNHTLSYNYSTPAYILPYLYYTYPSLHILHNPFITLPYPTLPYLTVPYILLQSTLGRLQQWCDNWQLAINTQQCFVLYLGFTNSQIQYTLDGCLSNDAQNVIDLELISIAI